MKKIISVFLISMIALLSVSCEKDEKTDDVNDNEEEEVGGLSYDFTLDGEKSEWRFEVDGKEYKGDVTVNNSMNNERYAAISLLSPYSFAAGISWLPLKTGTFKAGDVLTEIKGSATGEAHFNMSVECEKDLYYAYSKDAYANLEESLIAGTDCTVTVKKLDGKYVGYKLSGFTLAGFVGEIDLLFEGTFKTADGSKTIEIKKGEVRINNSLPRGAEIINY